MNSDILSKGRYNTWDLKDWLIILIFLTITALGAFLYTSAELKMYSFYLLGASLALFLFILIRFLFRGRFHVSKFNIVWKSTIGSLHSITFDKIGEMHLLDSNEGRVAWNILDLKGKKIKKLRAIAPVESAAIGILYFRYKDLLPEIVFNNWEPRKKGKRTYEAVSYQIKLDGNELYAIHGAIVLYEEKLLFIPTEKSNALSELEKTRIHTSELGQASGIYPEDPHIKTHTIIEAILESNLPTAIRDTYIQKVVEQVSGKIYYNMIKDNKSWHQQNEGIEVVISR